MRDISRTGFVRAWWAAAYLNPGLHPDGFDDPNSGWPTDLLPLAKEAWRRFDRGLITDIELYPADSVWAGICDGIRGQTTEERERRETLRQLELPPVST